MNKVILVGVGSDPCLPDAFPRNCPALVIDLSQFEQIECSFHYTSFDKIKIPSMPEPFSWEFSGFLINEDVVAQLRSLSHALAISMAEVVDAVRNLGKHTCRAQIDIASLTQELAKGYIEQEYEHAQPKPICTKPFKSKIKKSQYAASSYQRSGFQATRKLARGRI